MFGLDISTNEVMWRATGVVAFIALVVFVFRRWREHRRAVHYLEEAVKQELHIPASLHPVIDPDVCIGSGSCISACPEGEIIGLIDGVATLLKGSKCIGHGRCAAECPVDAIKLVFGSSKRGMDLPEVDEFFQSARKGVHIVGELAGMGLVKNALTQGLQVAAHFKETLTPGGRGEIADVVIVGAGPAGIATAVGCKAAGLSFRILEQENVGGTVANYPRQKLVMTDVVNLPFYGKFGQPQIRKEALVGMFQDVLKKAQVTVDTGVKVTGITGELDAFSVATSRGEVRGRRVVLAIGRGGTPRKLGVPGEDLPKVAYRLIDPEQFNDKRVLVVGGGDSALESAIMLGNESTAEVWISYRKPEFGRCRPLNKEKIADVVQRGRVTQLLGSEILSVTADAVELKIGAETKRIPNDYVIANLGGELPTDFLKAAGVSIKSHDGTHAMANPAMAGRKRKPKAKDRRGALLLVGLGALITVALFWVGRDYYTLPISMRAGSPQHAMLRPAGLWGHGVGVGATLFMLLNFVYPLRKRLKIWKGKSPIGPWLNFHVFVGTMSPIIILFHAAFQWGNTLATMTYLAVVTVALTGLIGRYIYGLVPTSSAAEATEFLKTAIARVEEQLEPILLLEGRHQLHALDTALALAKRPPSKERRSLVAMLVQLPFARLRLRLELRRAARFFLDAAAHREFETTFRKVVRLRTQVDFFRSIKRLMTGWRVLHVVLSIFLLAVITAHVWVSVRVGFKWIF